MSDSNHIDDPAPLLHPPTRNSLFETLKPKGACWYCNQPVDNVRRFCSRTCADDYRAEEETFSNPPP